MRYPERFSANIRCDEPTSLVDVLPTCLHVAGLQPQSEHIGADLAEVATGESERDAIIGQLGQGSTGLYMLLTHDFKYIHSAADQREWLFRRAPGMLDERSLVGNPAFAHIVNAYREHLIEFFRQDGYDIPLDDKNWREFPPPVEFSNSDAGQLFQDGRSVKNQFPQGYSPKVDTINPMRLRLKRT